MTFVGNSRLKGLECGYEARRTLSFAGTTLRPIICSWSQQDIIVFLLILLTFSENQHGSEKP